MLILHNNNFIKMKLSKITLNKVQSRTIKLIIISFIKSLFSLNKNCLRQLLVENLTKLNNNKK